MCVADHSLLNAIRACVRVPGKEHDATFVGVCGPVAAGKSHVAAVIRTARQNLVHFPFELWIDDDAVRDKRFPYRARFFWEKYLEDIKALRAKKHIVLPLTRLGTYDKVRSQGSCPHSCVRPGAEPPLVSQDVRRDVCMGGAEVVLVDGTLSCLNEARMEFDYIIYVDAPWHVRVARMIGRYLRQERVFGRTENWRSYVDYLVEEALTVADAEIMPQREYASFVLDPYCSAADERDLEMLRDLFHKGEIPSWYGVNQNALSAAT